MTISRSLPELVRDSKLEVIVRDNITIHLEPLECRDQVQPQRWETRRTIGRGGDGTVFLQRKVDGPGTIDSLAVKQMSLMADLACENHESKRYVRELEALAKFAQGKYSRYFVRSYGWYHEGDWLYICMEYCKHLDLGRYLKTQGTLSEEDAQVIAQQVLQGLFRMHKNGIAHRDLKPANILIQSKPPEDNAWWVVLGDLGLSQRSGASSGTTTDRGTPNFRAPETLGRPFAGDPKDANLFSADMWCLGETISCALTGHGTFVDNDHLLRYQKHLVDFPSDVFAKSGISTEAVDFVRSLMTVEPSKRLTAAEALNHPWITHNLNSALQIAAVEKPIFRTQSLIESSMDSPSDEQPTEASGEWTQTMSVRSCNALASAASIGTLSVLAPRATSPVPSRSNQLQVYTNAHNNIDEQTAENLALEKAPIEASVSSPEDSKTQNILPQWRKKSAHDWDDLVASFKQFAAVEKLRVHEQQKQRRLTTLNDLKDFSEQFRLHTPVPVDLVPILAKDEEKQRKIVLSGIEQAYLHNPQQDLQPQFHQNHVLYAQTGTVDLGQKHLSRALESHRWARELKWQETARKLDELVSMSSVYDTSTEPKTQETGKKKRKRRRKGKSEGKIYHVN